MGNFVATDADVPSGPSFYYYYYYFSAACVRGARDRLTNARFAEEQVKRREHGGA